MAFTAAELQKRHELEGAPDPFPSLGSSPAPNARASRPSSSSTAPTSNFIDTTSQDAFPSLGAPSSAPKPAASLWAGAAATAAKKPTSVAAAGGLGRGAVVSHPFTETFSIPSADLATGKVVTDTMKKVSEQTGAVVESSTQMRTGLKTFHIKAADQKKLALARKIIERGLSKPTTIEVEVPISSIGSIIGPKGATLKSITEATGCKIDVPRRDTLPAWEGRANGDVDEDDEDEPSVAISVNGPSAACADARTRLLSLVIQKPVTNSIKTIPSTHYLFIAGPRGSKSKQLEEEFDVKIHVPPPAVWKALEHGGDEDGEATPDRERDLSIKVKGDREKVKLAVAEIQKRYNALVADLRDVKVSIPKRQHRFLVGAAADDILTQTQCVVELAPIDDPSDLCIIRGPQSGLGPALGLVMEKANAVSVDLIDVSAIHRSEPLLHAKTVVKYLQRASRLRSIADKHAVKVYPPLPGSIAAGNVVIEIVGEDRAAVARAKEEIINAVKAVGPASVGLVEIDPVVHSLLIGKKGAKIAQFEAANKVATVFPPAADESSEVGLVYTGSLDSLPTEKKARDAQLRSIVASAAAALSELAKGAADIKTETLYIDKKWHRFIIGQGGTVLNALIGEDQLVNVKVSDTGVVVRGPSTEVDRVVASINQIVEDAKNDDIVNGHTSEFTVDKKHVPHLVGQSGAAINKLRESLGVKINFDDEKSGSKVGCKIVGRKEAVEEAKRRLVAQIEKLEDETTEIVKIKREIQPALIGAGGKYAIRLEDKYGVKLSFPRDKEGGEKAAGIKPDEVTIRGGKKGVAAAKAELLEAAAFETESRQSATFTVPSKAIAIIVGKSGATINAIKDDTGAQIDIDKAPSTDEKTTVTVRGDKKAIAAAKAAILAVVDEMGDEVTVSLKIDQKYHRSLIGQGGQKLRDTVASVGGDARQAGLITFPKAGDEVTDQVKLRGDRKLVEKIKEELEKQVKVLKETVVWGVAVPVANHATKIGRGGSALQDLQRKTNTAIHFPGSRQYNSVGEIDNSDDVSSADAADIVKVVGTKDAVLKAAEQLSIPVTERRSDSRGSGGAGSGGRGTPDMASKTIPIPAKYFHAIAEQPNLIRQIRSVGGHLNIPANAPAKIRPQPVNGNGNGVDLAARTARIDLGGDEEDEGAIGGEEGQWELRENYSGVQGEEELEWIVRAKEEDLDKAVAVLEKALQQAQSATHVGLLTGLPRSAFPRIIGSKGATITRLRAETGADINVGKEDDLITITGDQESVLQAKEAILQIVSRR